MSQRSALNAQRSSRQNKKTILLTGCAGFIGSNLLDKLLSERHTVIGVDDFNDYYSPSQKRANIAQHLNNKNFKLIETDINNLTIEQFNNETIDAIIHLAARAGVRASIQQPLLYEKVNVGGTLKMLELTKDLKAKHFIFGSSSSVYGNDTSVPFKENAPCDQPISPYAATKRAAELLCCTYHKLYKIPVTILRFFTVYGPRNRPDMAAFKFMDSIAKGKPIETYGVGTSRDYTFVNDIVNGIMASLNLSKPKFNIINLGNSSPVLLREFIAAIESTVGKKAILRSKPLPPSDVNATYADITGAITLLRWKPKINLETGLQQLWEWYALQNFK
ncbi:GDP-mannose 4,6-dehydratase [Candidatus Collierbacteria bacterium]|nr:GDP-mannose 4,6-dehydratase [Candidatus Collierbacteria bacterium]